MKRIFANVVCMTAMLVTSSCSRQEQRPILYHVSDEPLVERALNFHFHGKTRPPAILAQIYPVAVHFPGITCISLLSNRKSAQGGGTTCFDDATGKQLSYYYEDFMPTGKSEMPFECPPSLNPPRGASTS